MELRTFTSSLLGMIDGKSKEHFPRLVQACSVEAFWGFAECKQLQQCESVELCEERTICSTQSSFRSLSPHSEEDVEDFQPSLLNELELEKIMLEASNNVKSWEQGHFTLVKPLQDAARNQGRVDLFRSPSSRGSRLVAVKRMPTSWVREGPKEFAAEYPKASERPWLDIGIVRKLNLIGFPYACQLKGIFRNFDTTFVVSSLATQGDLFEWCNAGEKPGHSREQQVKPIALQVFEAVRWLHNLGIAHRDLSLENILLTQGKGGELQVRLIDFGMATLSQESCEVRGKQAYQAPEMHAPVVRYDAFLSDAFALGVVLFALAAQDYPWTCTKREVCKLFDYASLFGFRMLLEKRKLRQCGGECLLRVLSPAIVDVLEGLLHPDPAQRLTIGESCYVGREDKRSVWSKSWLESGC